MSRQTQLEVAAAVICVAVGVALCVCVFMMKAAHIPHLPAFVGQPHSFQLETTPLFLSEALAVEKAKETIALEGYDLGSWAPREDRRTTAPDGSIDVFFARSTIGPNFGHVTFVYQGDKPPKLPPIAYIELVGDRITCQVSLPR
jgi:hypothetical protein